MCAIISIHVYKQWNYIVKLFYTNKIILQKHISIFEINLLHFKILLLKRPFFMILHTETLNIEKSIRCIRYAKISKTNDTFER